MYDVWPRSFFFPLPNIGRVFYQFGRKPTPQTCVVSARHRRKTETNRIIGVRGFGFGRGCQSNVRRPTDRPTDGWRFAARGPPGYALGQRRADRPFDDHRWTPRMTREGLRSPFTAAAFDRAPDRCGSRARGSDYRLKWTRETVNNKY